MDLVEVNTHLTWEILIEIRESVSVGIGNKSAGCDGLDEKYPASWDAGGVAGQLWDTEPVRFLINGHQRLLVECC